MKSICIFCGEEKGLAHEACDSCGSLPESHEELIYSIIMSYSIGEPHLNFLSTEEIDGLQEDIRNGKGVKVSPQVFAQAEEAYGAVKSVESPQLINTFSKISSPIMMVILAMVLIGLIIGS